MAEVKTIQTRIINKNDSLANWTSNDPVLKQGEIALAYIETTTAGGNIVPTYLMKVGHGTKKFSELKWLAAPASDVFAWAKKEHITDNEEISGVIAQASTNKGAIATLSGRVDDLEGLVGGNVSELIAAAINALDVTDTATEGQFVTAVSETDGKITVSRAALKASDIPALGIDKITGLEDRLGTIEGDISGLKGQVGTGTVDSRIATAKSQAIETAAGDATTKAANAKSEAIAAAATDATTKANTAEANAKAYADGLAKNYDAAGDAAAAESRAKAYAKEYADGLAKNYDAAGSAAQALQDAKNYADDLKDSILGEGISETFDTLKEIETWINGAGVNATELTEAIAEEAAIRSADDTALGNRITELEKIDHDHSNKDVLDGITSTKVSNWDDANSKKHEHTNKSVLDGITSAKVTNWDNAEQAAKDYADGKIASTIANYSTTSQMNSAIATAKQEAIETAANDATSKANAAKAAVVGTSADGTNADTVYGAKKFAEEKASAAESNAKGYADSVANTAQANAKTYTDQEVKKVDDKVKALTTDDIAAGTAVWIFDCGTSSTVID